MEALCLGKNLCSWENQKRRKVLVKKKKGPKEKERKRIICQEKEKILCESNWYWRSSMLASRFRTKESPSNQKLLYIKLKRRFPFIFTSTSHDTKSSTIASNRNLDCRFVVLLLSFFFRFFHFAAGFSFAFGNFAYYCVVLLNPPLNDRD